MAKKSKTKKIHYKSLLFASILLAVFGMLTCFYGFNTTKIVNLSYDDSNSKVDYQVCSFDSTSPLIDKCAKREVYVANLIEYITASYSYVADFSAPISGDLSYQLIATVTATQKSSAGNSEFGSRSYPLTEVKTKSLANTKTLSIVENINIDYGYYNQILNDFRKLTPTAQGNLTVALVVDGQLSTDDLNKRVDFDSSIKMELPLAEQDVKISVKTENNQDANTEYRTTVSTDNISKLIARIIAIVAFIATLGLAIIAYRRYHEDIMFNRYQRNVDKIRSAYDSIIIEIRTPLDSRSLDIHEVVDFDELIDAYNAVHQPINFFRTDKASHFVVVNDKIAWCYTLYAADYKVSRSRKKRK